MAKIIKFKNEIYLSSKGVYHNLEGGGRVSLEDALNHIYPIGSIFITTVNQDPSKYLGGKWESFGAGRCLVGFDSGQTEFNQVLKTGGNKYLQSHYHDIRFQNPDGSGVTISCTGEGGSCLNIGDWNWGYNKIQSDIYTTSNLRTNREGTGDSGNLQPYIVVYMFKRIS